MEKARLKIQDVSESNSGLLTKKREMEHELEKAKDSNHNILKANSDLLTKNKEMEQQLEQANISNQDILKVNSDRLTKKEGNGNWVPERFPGETTLTILTTSLATLTIFISSHSGKNSSRFC